MKNKLTKIGASLTAMMYLFAVQAGAADSKWGTVDVLGETDDGTKIMSQISEFIKPIAAILIFVSVLMIGFEIIMKRNKADDRMASMSSLLWVGIGALVIAFAALLVSFLFPAA